MTMTMERESKTLTTDLCLKTFQELIADSTYPKPYEPLEENPLRERRLREATIACYELTFIAAGAATRIIADKNPAILVADNYLKFKAGEQLEGGFEVWRNQFGYLDALYEQAQLISRNS